DDQKCRLASDGDAPTRVTTEEEFENGSESSDTNHDVLNISPSQNSDSGLADALPVLSTLKYLIYVQLSLIVGLALFWLYDHV
ncbi:hypothetical protein B0H14DRAFT_3902764, partial [Mycena olivaceomarginata]